MDVRARVVYGADTFVAIEVKDAGQVRPADTRSLDAFRTDYPEATSVLLYRGSRRERRGSTWRLPIETALRDLHPSRSLAQAWGL